VAKGARQLPRGAFALRTLPISIFLRVVFIARFIATMLEAKIPVVWVTVLPPVSANAERIYFF